MMIIMVIVTIGTWKQ